MGQQQLLLLVLSAIIVGVSIVIGINMFSSGAVQANQDAVLQDCLMIAARAQEWYRKPIVMAGGGRSFTGLDSVGVLNIKGTNANGSFTLDGSAGVTAEIVGIGVEGMTITVVVESASIVSTDIIVP